MPKAEASVCKTIVEVSVMKVFRFLVVLVALTAFALSGVVMAAGTYYVVKDKTGSMMVSDQKPADMSSVVKGPFKSKEEAQKAMDEAKMKNK